LELRLWLLQQSSRLGANVPGLREWAYGTVVSIRRNRKSLRALKRRLDEQGRQLQIRSVMDWIEQASLHERPLVSVVLPTRDRCALLPRAIASVTRQTYVNWELLVVDDASADATAAVIAGISDKRVKGFRGKGGGVCAARNIGLSQARGSLVAYLDDDNIMHPGWLKAVVWAFEQHPATQVLYGAFIVDDKARLAGHGRGQLPQLYFHGYDYRAAARHNVADMGCIAHRAGLPEARFDESLREMGDWDLFLRLTRQSEPFALPAIACFYTTDAPSRLSGGPTFHSDLAAVRAKNRR
jgi:glycosyltransferase involved in cell wall biosynthesis